MRYIAIYSNNAIWNAKLFICFRFSQHSSKYFGANPLKNNKIRCFVRLLLIYWLSLHGNLKMARFDRIVSRKKGIFRCKNKTITILDERNYENSSIA